MVSIEHKQARGATLIEALISAVIFLIVALGWLSLEAALATQSGQSHVTSQAVFVAQSQVDFLRQIPYADLTTSDTPEYYDEYGLPSDQPTFYEVTWTVTDLPLADPTYKDITVSVAWAFNDAEFGNLVELTASRSK
jgi:Tfp pilus assembly protein PilV